MVSQIPFWKDIPSFNCLLIPNNFFELFRLRPSLWESKAVRIQVQHSTFSCYSLCSLMSWFQLYVSDSRRTQGWGFQSIGQKD